MTERRTESRLSCADLVKVDWLEGEDTFHTAEAVLEDISHLGACVQTEDPIPVSATIIISVAEQCFCGFVTYCIRREFGCFVGIHFSEESAWWPGCYLPDHLTDFAALALSEPEAGAN